MWLEHSLSLSTQGDLAAWFGSVPAVPEACRNNALLGPEGCKNHGMDNFGSIRFWTTPVASCGGGRTCVPYYRWVTSYIAVIGGR
jgi:putative spermidine/putrescine transport system substrate-binding protein